MKDFFLLSLIVHQTLSQAAFFSKANWVLQLSTRTPPTALDDTDFVENPALATFTKKDFFFYNETTGGTSFRAVWKGFFFFLKSIPFNI
jgi:hypothetical protein